MVESHEFLCSARTSVNPRPTDRQNLEKTSLTVLYSNVRGLHQARGELCKTCSELRPSIVCLTETHLLADATDSFCPLGYVVAVRRDISKHGGGVLILAQEAILFEEIDTSAIAMRRQLNWWLFPVMILYLSVVIVSHLLVTLRYSLV